MKFCHFPFTRMHISENGDVYLCCSGWMNQPIGNIYQKNLKSIWNSDKAKIIRRSILNESFHLCDETVCPHIISGEVYSGQQIVKYKNCQDIFIPDMKSGPDHISLNYDYSCNLMCRSCRPRIKKMPEDKVIQLIDFQNSLLKSELFNQVKRIVVTGAGEPFASRVFLDLFSKINQNEFPDLKITLRTNGILLNRENWEKISGIHYAVDSILISIDAVTEKTYNKIRLKSCFKTLKKNLKFVNQIKRNKKFKLGFNFVVQKENYREMPEFVRFAKKYNCDEVTFTQLMNLGTFSVKEYSDQAVHLNDNPDFNELRRIVNTRIFRDPIVNLNNLSNIIA